MVSGQIATSGDLTFSLGVACRMKLTLNESYDIAKRERGSEVLFSLSITER